MITQKIKSKINNFIDSQQFNPTFLGIFVNPFYLARNGLSCAIKNFSSELSGKILDVGCGTMPYRSLFNSVDNYVGLEISRDGFLGEKDGKYYYDGKQFPFDDNVFDGILCNQVLEHVFNPDEFLQEMKRVIKPGGRILLTIPFVWDEHEHPYDYARYSTFGLKALLEKQGLMWVRHQKIRPDISTVFQLLNAYLYKITEKIPYRFKLILYATVMSSVSLFGLLLSKLLPPNPDLFLDHIVLIEKNQ
ncbi:class I SAM-dependent methyltransferase [Pseudanabaena mucicola]|uniref:Class I SAM-dependent methyltransferase n=1 Tax=Pseudanabaena mucicola FACHB-723 TaxID=2692860 RepID=A0ABR7ZTQ6_9CYAN|nr:class I SAM-dependent methyltransferase [Pseudanabaena mucicola]MBD2187105.1 class I SAM-dependent methyltransferase [Pseudanabaena mucicola FACHB-723]